MMECGDAHLCDGGKFFDAQGLGVVGLEPTHCLCSAVALLAEGGDGTQVAAKWAAQDAVDNFALHEAREERDIAGCVEQVE